MEEDMLYLLGLTIPDSYDSTTEAPGSGDLTEVQSNPTEAFSHLIVPDSYDSTTEAPCSGDYSEVQSTSTGDLGPFKPEESITESNTRFLAI